MPENVSDTVDIEDLANQFGKDFVEYYTNMALVGLGVTGFPAFLIPICRAIVEAVVAYIGHQGGLIVYVFNTTLFTTDQGNDYIDATTALSQADQHISDEDWEKLEEGKNHAFRNLVNYRK